MNHEMIERLAREAGLTAEVAKGMPWLTVTLLPQFARAVAEECAKMADTTAEYAACDDDLVTAKGLADAIRKEFGLTPAPADAQPPTSPPAAGSSR